MNYDFHIKFPIKQQKKLIIEKYVQFRFVQRIFTFLPCMMKIEKINGSSKNAHVPES